ncbi:hypothetical protein, partial [Lactococcus lactis]|uniref:hypothetical protein n=1 Tax=Lactococcus lactis TaxID=1358 RepID=UPI003D115D72
SSFLLLSFSIILPYLIVDLKLCNRTDYTNGSLENTYTKNVKYTLEKQGIREHVVEILEGGKEAFEKREKKYK